MGVAHSRRIRAPGMWQRRHLARGDVRLVVVAEMAAHVIDHVGDLHITEVNGARFHDLVRR